jgi:hypothetical protein
MFAFGALASCQNVEPPAQGSVIDTREAMVSGINSAAVAIWDIAHEAQGESDELDPVLETTVDHDDSGGGGMGNTTA